MNKFLVVMLAALTLITGHVREAVAEQTEFRFCTSPYSGWEPIVYAYESGILKKHADKYGIKIIVDRVNEYVQSINAYMAGTYDGCAMTNMDALTMPAVGGVDSEVIVVGDYSNGNDGVVMKTDKPNPAMRDLKSFDIKGVEFTVTQFLVSRGLEKHGMSEKDITFTNASDRDIVAIYYTMDGKKIAVGTWKPMLSTILEDPKAKVVFDSSQIPGEILDLYVVRTGAPENFKKALTGAWYEMMSILDPLGTHKKAHDAAIAFMARISETTPKGFEAQLKTTALYYKAVDAAAFVRSVQLKDTMELVRTFCYNHGLYGAGAPSKDYVGIRMPDGSVLGDSKNLQLRFTDKYMRMAAEGKL